MLCARFVWGCRNVKMANFVCFLWGKKHIVVFLFVRPAAQKFLTSHIVLILTFWYPKQSARTILWDLVKTENIPYVLQATFVSVSLTNNLRTYINIITNIPKNLISPTQFQTKYIDSIDILVSCGQIIAKLRKNLPATFALKTVVKIRKTALPFIANTSSNWHHTYYSLICFNSLLTCFCVYCGKLLSLH